MKRIGIVFLLMIFTLVWADEVQIRRIKLLIEEEKYIWEIGDDIPEKAEGTLSSPNTVLSFIGLKPGQSLDETDLEKAIYRAEKRLINSSYFYDARVSLIPSRNDPAVRTLMIKVTEGFRDRFGGGNAFALWGRENLWGERKSVFTVLGLNEDSISWQDDLVGGTPFFYGGSGGYSGTWPYSAIIETRKIRAALEGGYRFSPALSLGLEGTFLDAFGSSEVYDLNSDHWGGANYRDITLFLPFEYNEYNKFKWFFKDMYSRASLSPGCIIPLEDLHFVPGIKTSAESYLSKDFLFLDISAKAEHFWGSRNGFRKSNLQNRIRSDYPFPEMISDSWASGSFELGIHLPDINFFNLTQLRISPFAFTDLGYIRDDSGQKDEYHFRRAYGGAIAFYLKSPVYLNMELSAGFNETGDMRISFSTGMSY